ncbi:hypothetical protein DS62_00560 [Smithella sp. SC_K08D17]|nr:hypothetical protein DS62_00560 [Smithella sp. SC_K08D17]
MLCPKCRSTKIKRSTPGAFKSGFKKSLIKGPIVAETAAGEVPSKQNHQVLNSIRRRLEYFNRGRQGSYYRSGS